MKNSTPFSEPEAVPEAFPETASNFIPSEEPTSEVTFEPLPHWDQAIETWQWAWHLHWAGLGALFCLLAVYALWSLIDLAGRKHRRKPLLAIVISFLLLLFASTRAAFFFINPYESKQCFLPVQCPVILTRTLFGIAYPCITASFFLVHLAFLQLSKLTLYPQKLQSVKFVACVIAIHFSLSLITEVMISLYAGWRAFTIACETFFLVLSLILSLSFIYSGRAILKSVHKSRSSVRKFSDLTKKQAPPPNVAKLVKITYITVVLGLISVVLQLYSIMVVRNMYSTKGTSVPKPWPWLIFESAFRLVELGLGCTMAYVNPRQVSGSRRRSWSSTIRIQWKLSGAGSIYGQNQSSPDNSASLNNSVSLNFPSSNQNKTAEMGFVNEGGSFDLTDQETKQITAL